MTRVLYVLEALDASQQFQPKVGFDTMGFLELWIKNHLPMAAVKTSEWRIVKYVPLEPETFAVH